MTRWSIFVHGWLPKASLAVLFAIAATPCSGESKPERPEFVRAINVAHDMSRPPRRPVVIAVVDDGFRLSHVRIRDLIWWNEGEIPGNGVDDDLNGFVDDLRGWDVSDGDNDVWPPEDLAMFHHGTHIAGVIAEIVTSAYDDGAADYVRILPVKAVSDNATDSYVRDGFAGIEYAVKAGADIILAPWVVSRLSRNEERILDAARENGVLVVASGGNVSEERDQFPAAHDTVLAVGAIEIDGSYAQESTYGQFVDLAAPGTGIMSADSLADDRYTARDGSSLSAAMVATAAAMVKVANPGFSATELSACLITSSGPIETPVFEKLGKIGAGTLDIGAAVECTELHEESPDARRLDRSKGFIRANRRRAATLEWIVQPKGKFEGIILMPVVDREQIASGTFEIYSGTKPGAPVFARYTDNELPDRLIIPGNTARIVFVPRRKRSRLDFLMGYEMQTIDFRTLYCSGTQELRNEGVIADGSGPENYSANTDCRWLITAPPGKIVTFQFDQLDTEPRTDLIYFFNGAGTHEKIMAIVSGRELPPKISTWSNQVLVWFVSNGKKQGSGWQARYEFVDSPQ